MRVQACGCQTDLDDREGGINDESRSSSRTRRRAWWSPRSRRGLGEPGDFVVLNWRAVCGVCRSCRRGRPWYCFNTHNAVQKMTLSDGTRSPPRSASAFAEKTWWPRAVHQGGPGRAARGGGSVGLRGDGGLGSAMLTGGVGTGESVAASAAAETVVPPSPGRAWPGRRRSSASTSTGASSSRPWFGATDVVDGSKGDPVEAVRALNGGNGADVWIEAVGNPAVTEQAFYARDLAGTLVQVGVPTPDMRIDLPMIEFFAGAVA